MSSVKRYPWGKKSISYCATIGKNIASSLHPVVNMVSKVFTGHNVIELLSQDYIYNLSWEDPQVDHVALDLGPDDKICMITTGGDNVLDYLIADPKHIVTVDCNAHQNYLLEMKMASMKALPQDEFFRIFGESDYELFLQRYVSIRNHMSDGAQEYWDVHKVKMKSFIFSGLAHYVLYIFRFALFICGMSTFFYVCISGDLDIDAQVKVYEDKYQWRLRILTYVCESIFFLFAPLIGVPDSQVNLLPGRFIFASIDYLIRQSRLSRNYFYTGYLIGHFTDKSCPRYMSAEYYDFVKERLDRVTIKLGFLDVILDRDFPDDYFTKATLLDHMDWLTEAQVANEWCVLQKKMTSDALLQFRSASEGMPFDVLKFLDYKISTPIICKDYENMLPVDRVGTYHSIHVVSIPEDYQFKVLGTVDSHKRSLVKDVVTLRHMYLPKFNSGKHTKVEKDHKGNNQHENWLEDFYSDQADNYDSYRSRMLHGKQELMLRLPIFKGASWIEIGGGTGDSLGYIAENVHLFSSVEVLDLCKSLLKVCDKRIKKEGWNNVKTIYADATKFVPKKKYDLITLSYSLTMIPNWKEVIDNVYKWLKPGGLLGLADFTILEEQSSIGKNFWKNVFAIDHVYLSAQHLPYLREKFEEEIIYGHKKGGFPFIPLAKCYYYYAVFRKEGGKINFGKLFCSNIFIIKSKYSSYYL
eukprot:g927.t1